MGILGTEAIPSRRSLCGIGFAFRFITVGSFARTRNRVGDPSSAGSASENRTRSTSRAQRMVICVVVCNRDSAGRRDVILFIAERIERVVIIPAGIFKRLGSS